MIRFLLLQQRIREHRTDGSQHTAEGYVHRNESVAPGTYNIEMKNAECAHSTYILSTYRERTSTLTVTKPSSVDGVTASLLSGPVAIYNAAGVKVRAIEHCTSREELTEGLAPGAYTVKGGGATVKIIKQ